MFKFICNWCQTFFIEFEESINYFVKEKLVITHKWVQPCFGVKSSAIWVPLISQLLSKIGNNLLKSFKMWNIFTNQSFRIGIIFLPHKCVESLLIISYDFPSWWYACENIDEILHPTVQILVFTSELLILSSVVLKF